MKKINPFRRNPVDPEIEEGMLAEFRQVSRERKGYDWSDDMWVAYNRMLEKFPNRKEQVHNAYIDLSARLMKRQWRMERKEEADELGVLWNELGEMYPENTFVEKNNRTYEFRKVHFVKKLRYMREILKKMHGHQNPIERVILDERLNFIEERFSEFTYKVNPHHIQPGLIVDIDVTTTKRKQYMLKAMAGMLNEFLFDVSKGFADAAFASYSRRRSTVREDIDQTFATEEKQENIFETAYRAGAEEEVKGTVDLTPQKGKKGKGKTRGLKEL